jgi:anti-sigma factor RsiW
MEIDDTVLRAYVDGELSSSERGRVEAAVAQSESLKADLAALRASCLPYSAAFDAEQVPPVPTALAERMAMFSAVAAANQSVPNGLTSSANAKKQSGDQVGERRNWLRWAGMGAALAASFGAGVGTQSFWFRSNGSGSSVANVPEVKGGPQVAKWVQAVASYQALYLRDTVDRPADSQERAAEVIAEFQNKTQTKLVVPDLAKAGFEFKRVQRLQFENKPLLQIAYLPKVGLTGALCMMQSETNADVELQVFESHGLSGVTWQRAGLSYVFVADTSSTAVKAIGEQLVAAQFPTLHRV